MKSSKRLVFSVYSHDLEDYPYYPFIGDSIQDGIKKFVKFCNTKNNICSGAELHWIGTCEQYYDKDNSYGILENIQPLMLPQRITFKRDFFGRIISQCFVLGVLFQEKVVSYIRHYLCREEKNGK